MSFKISRYGNHHIGNNVYTLRTGMEEEELKKMVKQEPALKQFITFDKDDNDKAGNSTSGTAKSEPKSGTDSKSGKTTSKKS